MISNRMQQIKSKGFGMRPERDLETEEYKPTDFSKIKVGVKTLEDAVLTLGSLTRIDKRYKVSVKQTFISVTDRVCFWL